MRLLGIILLFCSNAHALETVALQGVSKLVDASLAKAEIQKSMTQKVASEAILDLVGVDKYRSNQSAIKKIIEKKVNRFIPVINNGNLLKDGDEYKMVVSFKISYDDLRQILKQDGLFKIDNGQLSVLPMISVTDAINGQAHAWWLNSEDDLSKTVVDIVKNKFSDSSGKIQVSSPKNDKKLQKLIKPSFSTSDYIKLGKEFGYDVVMVGNLKFASNSKKRNQSVINSKFYAISVVDGRIIGEISNRTQVSKNKKSVVSKDVVSRISNDISDSLVKKVVSSWNNGEIGADIIYLRINGELSYPKVVELKQAFNTSFPGVYSFKEHIFRKDNIIFKLESNRSPRRIANQLSNLKLKIGKLGKVRTFGNRISIAFK